MERHTFAADGHTKSLAFYSLLFHLVLDSHAFAGEASRDGGSRERSWCPKGRISAQNGKSNAKKGRIGEERITTQRVTSQGEFVH